MKKKLFILTIFAVLVALLIAFLSHDANHQIGRISDVNSKYDPSLSKGEGRFFHLLTKAQEKNGKGQVTGKGSQKNDGKTTENQGSNNNSALVNRIIEKLQQASQNGSSEELNEALHEIIKRKEYYVPELLQIASHKMLPPVFRIFAVGLLGKLADLESLDTLLQLVKDVTDDSVRAETIKALGKRNEAEAEACLREIAQNSDDRGRAMAISFLGKSQDPESKSLLVKVIEKSKSSLGKEDAEANAALYALRHYNDVHSVQFLIAQTKDDTNSSRLRATALYSLGVTGDNLGLESVKQNLSSSEREVRYSAVLAAGRIFDKEVALKLVEHLCDPMNYEHVREAASVALRNHNPTIEALDYLQESLKKSDSFGILLAGKIFAERKDISKLEMLREYSLRTKSLYLKRELEKDIALIEGASAGE